MNFSKKVNDTVAEMRTNDDLYNINLQYIAESKTLDALHRLLHSVEYHEIALSFRDKQLTNCGHEHGTLYESYNAMRTDAFNQLLCARDRLQDYCDKHKIDYLSLFG